MKSLKVTLALIIATSSIFVSCKKENKTSEVKTTETKEIAKAETTSLEIEGMTCAVGCAKVIESKISGLEGVQKATIDFEKKTATIEYNAAIQSPEKIVETVEAIADGKTYKVVNVKSTADQAMLYQENPTQEKPKKTRATRKSKADAAAATATPTAAAPTEKKAGCCASKKSCSAEKPATL